MIKLLKFTSYNFNIITNLSINQCRNTSFIVRVRAEQLWQGAVGVSNAGKKKGRGKRVGRKKITDLNKGQYLGLGKLNMLWPGLNAPVIQGREVINRKKLPEDPQKWEEINRMRDKMSRIRYIAKSPLLRGYSGSKFAGQSVGPPDPVADYNFEGFDSRVLEFKMVCNMTGTLGRKMRFSALVATGNKNGLAGYALAKSQNARAAIKAAKNKAAQQLMYISRCEDHTVFHNMFTQHHRTKIFIHKRGEGFGLRCHRVLKTICELIGIKNVHCKVENSTKNIQALTRAFFDALTHQETHEELANRMGYHLVEFRKEEEYVPKVVASPTVVKDHPPTDLNEDIEVAFERLYYGGKCELVKPKKWPLVGMPPQEKKQNEILRNRGQYDARILRLARLA